VRDWRRPVAVPQCVGLRLLVRFMPRDANYGGKVLFTGVAAFKAGLPWRCDWGPIRSIPPQLPVRIPPRIARRLGKPSAITATPHKLARIVFHLLTTKEAYRESIFMRCEEEAQKRAELRLKKHAAQLGFQLIPAKNGQRFLGSRHPFRAGSSWLFRTPPEDLGPWASAASVPGQRVANLGPCSARFWCGESEAASCLSRQNSVEPDSPGRIHKIRDKALDMAGTARPGRRRPIFLNWRRMRFSPAKTGLAARSFAGLLDVRKPREFRKGIRSC
jgi:hypothetical protein